MKAIRMLISLQMLALTLSACGLSPRQTSPAALHDFGPAPAAISYPTWQVARVEAPPWLEDERMAYRLLYADPTRVRFYAHSRWLAPPPKLLEQFLAAAGGGSNVRLWIRLLSFEQLFDAPGESRVVLRFAVSAQAGERGEKRDLGEREFHFERKSASADAAGAVAAYAAMGNEAVAAVGVWLAKSLPAAASEAAESSGSP